MESKLLDISTEALLEFIYSGLPEAWLCDGTVKLDNFFFLYEFLRNFRGPSSWAGVFYESHTRMEKQLKI
jgi:hypothetical protein